MNRFVWIVCALGTVLIAPSTVAQDLGEGPSSVGFSAPDSTQPVRAYRLPSWHWSTWTLSGLGYAQHETYDGERLNSTDRQVDVSIRPRYRGLWESEGRQAFLTIIPSLSLDRYTSSLEGDNRPDRDSESSDYAFSLDTDGTFRKYVGGRMFFLASGSGVVEYYGDRDETTEMSQTTDASTRITTRAKTDFRIGVGVGRVRVVTPVIRALRVRERMRTLGVESRMSNAEVQRAARQLARRPGYTSVYDRADKYFWRDFFGQTGVSGLSSFETFYVADALREPVGIRREGAEVQIGPTASYRRILDRTEEDGQLTERTLSSRRTLGAFLLGRVFRNLSLRHQVGGTLRTSYTHGVDEYDALPPITVDRVTRKTIRVEAEGQWLWVLADRVRADTRARYSPVRGFRKQRVRSAESLLRVLEPRGVH